MTSVPQGVVYPTHDGLVALSQNSAATLITHALYAPDDWHKLMPESVRPIYFNGRLYIFAKGGDTYEHDMAERHLPDPFEGNVAGTATDERNTGLSGAINIA